MGPNGLAWLYGSISTQGHILKDLHTTNHCPLKVAQPEDAMTEEKNVVLCTEQGKRNTDLGEEKGRAWPQKDSLHAQGWDVELEKEPVLEVELCLCHTMQRLCLWAQKQHEFTSAP